jgi:hypothetical protein
MKDSGFAARMLQKDLQVHGRTFRAGPLRIINDARVAKGQSVGVALSWLLLCS